MSDTTPDSKNRNGGTTRRRLVTATAAAILIILTAGGAFAIHATGIHRQQQAAQAAASAAASSSHTASMDETARNSVNDNLITVSMAIDANGGTIPSGFQPVTCTGGDNGSQTDLFAGYKAECSTGIILTVSGTPGTKDYKVEATAADGSKTYSYDSTVDGLDTIEEHDK